MPVITGLGSGPMLAVGDWDELVLTVLNCMAGDKTAAMLTLPLGSNSKPSLFVTA